MLKQKFAIVDLETTGGSFLADRVIEVGVIVMENGQITETFQSLINPERYIPQSIQQLTGIRESQLWDAPTFSMLKDKLKELLDGAIFVAHNAKFDQGFLKAEFARLEIPFNPKTLCTVQLSRKVFPEHRHHNLDALMLRLGVNCENRHRALDDAKVLHEFFLYLEEKFSESEREEFFRQVLKEIYIPPNLSKEKLKDLPQEPGVYIFYDENAFPIYVGKSINIHNRVLSHFHSCVTSSKEMKIFQKVHSIETIKTCGELGALLLESQMVKKLQPLHNRKLRKVKILTTLQKQITAEGYETVEVASLDQIEPTSIGNVMGIFRSKKQAENYLEEVAKEFILCKKLLHLEKNFECFGYQLKRCKGACLNEESPADYNSRFQYAFEKTALRPWPYKGIVALEERNTLEGKGQVFFISDWCLIATGKYSESGFSVERIPDKIFDYDQYKILNRHLSKTASRKLKILSEEQFQLVLSES